MANSNCLKVMINGAQMKLKPASLQWKSWRLLALPESCATFSLMHISPLCFCMRYFAIRIFSQQTSEWNMLIIEGNILLLLIVKEIYGKRDKIDYESLIWVDTTWIKPKLILSILLLLYLFCLLVDLKCFTVSQRKAILGPPGIKTSVSLS